MAKHIATPDSERMKGSSLQDNLKNIPVLKIKRIT
jgi:hypothetical protein